MQSGTMVQAATAFLMIISCAYLSALNLEIVSLLPKSISIAPSLTWTEPAFRFAVDMVNRRYAPLINMSLKLIFNTSHKTCYDADAENPTLLAAYYYRQREDRCLAVTGVGKSIFSSFHYN